MWWLVLFTAAHAQPLLEAYIGPERSVGRVIGMGGAHVALAENLGARPDNPAAFAVRRPLRADTWFQLVGEAGLMGFNPLRHDPFSPEELDASEPSSRVHASGGMRFGPFGFGGIITRTGYAYSDPAGYARLQHGLVGIGAGWQVGEFAVGIMPQLHYGAITVGDTPVFQRSIEALSLGVGIQGGVRWAPEGERWMFGLAGTPPLYIRPVGDRQRSVELVVPGSVVVGAAWRTQPNVAPTYGEGEAPDRGGRYLLFAADLRITGPSLGAPIAAIATPRPAGAPTTFSLHLGAEAEIIERRLAVRLGTYNEPGRFEDVDPRVHGTGGVSVLVAELPIVRGLRLSGTVDLAREWTQFGLGVGAW